MTTGQSKAAMRSLSDLANPHVDGLTPYETGRPVEDLLREMGWTDAASIVKLASNENALGPSPMAVEAMQRALAQSHRYPDGGAYALKAALSEHLQVAPDAILPCNGSNEAIELLGHAFLGPERGIVMGERAFVVYRLVADLMQAETRMAPMPAFTHDVEALLAAITPKTRLVFIANPNNPTGTQVTEEALVRLVEQVPDHVAVVIDEAYIELLPPDRQPDTLRFVREGRPVFLLRTFSKTYGLAALRLGYVVAPAEGIGLLNRVRQPFHVNAVAQAGAIAALRDEGFVEETRRTVREGLDFLEQAMQEMGLATVPSAVNFLLIETGRGREVFMALQREGVIVRPMNGYGLPDHIRVTVGTPAENRRFVDALRKVLAAGEAA